jgi:hypothetical protein
MATRLGVSDRSTKGKRKFDDSFVDSSTIDKDLLNERVSKTAKTIAHATASVGGRSSSAPAVGWRPPAGSGQIIYPDVKATAATDAWMDPV